MSLQTWVHQKVSRLGEAIIFFVIFFLFIYFSYDFLLAIFFCCHLCLLVHWPQRYYCKFTRRAQSGLRPELELHLKALASSIAKPKRNALHSAVLLHGTMGAFCAVLSKKLIIYYMKYFNSQLISKLRSQQQYIWPKVTLQKERALYEEIL